MTVFTRSPLRGYHQPFSVIVELVMVIPDEFST